MLVVTPPIRAGQGPYGLRGAPMASLFERPLLPLHLAAAVGQMQALALLGLALLALLGIVGPGVRPTGAWPEPGSGNLLASGGITSGARSATLRLGLRASWRPG